MNTQAATVTVAQHIPVFISYNQTPINKYLMVQLSNSLRQMGIDSIIDQDKINSFNYPIEWTQWEAREIARATKVLVFLTQTYYLRALGEPEITSNGESTVDVGHGARGEARAVYRICSTTEGTNKCVPIVIRKPTLSENDLIQLASTNPDFLAIYNIWPDKMSDSKWNPPIFHGHYETITFDNTGYINVQCLQLLAQRISVPEGYTAAQPLGAPYRFQPFVAANSNSAALARNVQSSADINMNAASAANLDAKSDQGN